MLARLPEDHDRCGNRSDGNEFVGLTAPVTGQHETQGSEPPYGIAFASFAPLNTDIFIVDADRSHAKPLIAHPELDKWRLDGWST